MPAKLLKYFSTIAIVLALFVVMLGAFTRLTDAGLGCPDWPGCYGKMVLPSAADSLSQAQAAFPETPIESQKAWTEMAHRYAAGSLAILIFLMGALSIIYAKGRPELPRKMPIFLMLLVIFQALLGMWTVTLKLLPIVVMSHLLGGMLIFSCLVRLRWQLSDVETGSEPRLRLWLSLLFLLVFFQIALGGWVSANYAGIACFGFPTCNGLWWPEMHFLHGFNLFSLPGENYQGGLLESDVRASIQVVHRLGAVVVWLLVNGIAGYSFFKSKNKAVKMLSVLAMVLVWIQFSLGVMNVVYLLPLAVAVAHNGVAALLLATLFSLLHFVKKGGCTHAG